MDSLIATFHIDWKLMIAQAVNFTIVIVVLWRFALRPLKKLMDERSAEIEGGIENAAKQKELLESSKAEHKAAIIAAQKEAQALIEAAKKIAADETAKMIAAAQDVAAATIAHGKEELANEQKKMLTEAKAELADMVVASTERVLEGMPVKAIDRALVDKALAKK